MLADYLGLTKETVSRQMTALRRAGIIKQEGRRRLIVPDRARLLDQTGSSPPSGNGIWDAACQPENRDQQQFLKKMQFLMAPQGKLSIICATGIGGDGIGWAICFHYEQSALDR